MIQKRDNIISWIRSNPQTDKKEAINRKLEQLGETKLDFKKIDQKVIKDVVRKFDVLIGHVDKLEKQNKVRTVMERIKRSYDSNVELMQKAIQKLKEQNINLRRSLIREEAIVIENSDLESIQKLKTIKQIFNLKKQGEIDDLNQNNQGYKKIIASLIQSHHNLLAKIITLNKIHDIQEVKYSRIRPFSFVNPTVIVDQVAESFKKSCQQIYTSYRGLIQKEQ